MDKFAQVETLSLRDYIDKEMTRLRDLCLKRLESSDSRELLPEILCDNARNIALQEIAYRLEYGFITEMGKTSLKHHLSQA